MNKIERVHAVLRGEKPDRVPAGFWFHYPGTLTAEETAAEHIKLFRETDMDIIKIMQDFPLSAHGHADPGFRLAAHPLWRDGCERI